MKPRDFWFDSKGGGRLHGCRWEPSGTPKAVVQIVHGITDYARRYDEIGSFLAQRGYLVVAEDHMARRKDTQQAAPRYGLRQL